MSHNYGVSECKHDSGCRTPIALHFGKKSSERRNFYNQWSYLRAAWRGHRCRPNFIISWPTSSCFNHKCWNFLPRGSWIEGARDLINGIPKNKDFRVKNNSIWCKPNDDSPRASGPQEVSSVRPLHSDPKLTWRPIIQSQDGYRKTSYFHRPEKSTNPRVVKWCPKIWLSKIGLRGSKFQ